MINIEKIRMELRAWKKEKVLQICKEYNIPIDEELKQKTKREIEHIILDRIEDLNRIEEEENLKSSQEELEQLVDSVGKDVETLLQEETPTKVDEIGTLLEQVETLLQEEEPAKVEEVPTIEEKVEETPTMEENPIIVEEPITEETPVEEVNNDTEESLVEQVVDESNEDEYLGKEFIKINDKSISPTVFVCIDKGKDRYTFTFPGGKIEIGTEDIPEMLIPYDKEARRKKYKEHNNTLVIQVPTTSETSTKDEEPKVIKVDLAKPKDNKTKKTETKSKTKNTEPLVGAGRGRITAKILCFDSPDRKNPIKEFNTFADARVFLNVKSVGDSLERASETGKPSRGYWWIVQDISKPQPKAKKEDKKVEKDVKVTVETESPKQEESKEPILITPPVMEKKPKQEEEIDDLDLFRDMEMAAQ